MSTSLGPGATFGSYRIESQLGRGGMSVVYLAEDPRLARRVAIKVLAPELAEDESFRNRFVRESQLAAGLDHPNIVPVYEAGEVDGHLFIAMRYVHGTDLRALILREGTLDPERTTSLIRPVAGALDAAHRRGLVHRDVKPANILVAFDEGEEHPYLSDFGLTKHTSSKSGLTKTGTFMGTVDYVAPEQIQGGEVDGRTDEYSLACVVYQCLTGAVPFDKGTDVATLFAHLQDPLPRVSGRRPGVPAELDEVIARGMAKEREDRHPTCTAMMDLIAGAIGLPVRREAPSIDPTVVAAPPQPGLGPLLPAAPEPSVPPISSVPPVTPSPVTTTGPAAAGAPRPSRTRLAVIAGALIGIVAIGAAVLLFSGGSEPPIPPEPTGPSPPTVVVNADPIEIPKAGSAVPYPSSIDVSGLRGVVTDVGVTLEGFGHSFPDDLDVLLAGPQGETVLLMEGVGGTEGVRGLTVTFDDEGGPLNDTDVLVTGTFRPSSSATGGFGFNGPPPAPRPAHGAALSVFNGTDPNGTWSLFVFDDSARDAGRIDGGWSLHLELGAAATGGTGPTGASGAPAGNVIFRDDFSDPTSGWDVFDQRRSHGLYRDGAYVLGVQGGFFVTGDFNTSTQELSTLGDVHVEATGQLLGTTNAVYGLVCRAATPDNYYYFLIEGDGTYYIGENVQNDAHNFDTGVSPAVETGGAPNRIAIECVDGPEGVTLRLSVNGVGVNTVVDAEDPFRTGAAGFRAESKRLDMEVAFDDFLVTEPA